MAILNVLNAGKDLYDAAPQHVGAWGTKDFGITELISDAAARVRGVNPTRTAQGGSQGFISPFSRSDQGQVLGISTNANNSLNSAIKNSSSINKIATDTGGSGGGGNSTQGLFTNVNFTSPTDQVGNTGRSESDVINSEFDSFNNFLNEQEGLANTQFSNTQGQINTGLDTALNQLGGERDLRTQQLDQTAAGGRQTERLNLARVNQLLQDLQQRDNARMAITGGGSTNEALADRFARRAQSSIGDVVNEGQRFQNDVAMETERVNQFYDNKTAELRSAATNAINEARLRLDDSLSRIRNERNIAANQKATAQIEAWKNYYNQVRQAQFEVANFQQQLDMWKQQREGFLAQGTGLQLNQMQGQDISGVISGLQNPQMPAIGGNMQASAQLPATRVNMGRRGQDDEMNRFLA